MNVSMNSHFKNYKKKKKNSYVILALFLTTTHYTTKNFCYLLYIQI